MLKLVNIDATTRTLFPNDDEGGESGMHRKRVGILIFPAVEVLDFCGPFEVFTITRLNDARRADEPPPFEVLVVAEESGVLVASGGLQVIPSCTIAECPHLDILVVAGGWGVHAQLHNDRLIHWIKERGRQVETIASVCTGSMLLGQAGLLDGQRATTHWRSIAWMRESFPRVTVVTDQHVVEDGNLITSAGISAGLDMSLRLVARYFGEDVARSTANHMEYRHPCDNTRRVPL